MWARRTAIDRPSEAGSIYLTDVVARDMPRPGNGAAVQIGSLEQRWDCLTPICSIFEQNGPGPAYGGRTQARCSTALPAKARWTIVKADPTTRRIEASEQSFWMGFTDDTVVRVAEADSGSRIDVRSTSRHGRSDLGVNAARIRTSLAALHDAEKPGN